jgi:hypothetical protein
MNPKFQILLALPLAFAVQAETIVDQGSLGDKTGTSIEGGHAGDKTPATAKLLEYKSDDGSAKSTYPSFIESRYSQLNRLLADEAKSHFDACVEWVKDAQHDLKDAGSTATAYRWKLARVESTKDDLVSVSYQNTEFEGGAHPNTINSGVNYRIAPDGTPNRIGLWDVLVKSDTTIKMLSDTLIDGLKSQNAAFAQDGTVKDFTQTLKGDGIAFVIVPNGIAFMFSPYEVGSYADGDYRVVIPYSRLAGTIRADGTLADAGAKP